MTTNRRDFLRTTGGAILGTWAGAFPVLRPLHAGPDGDKGEPPPTLVVLYLRGGIDSLGAIIPWSDPRYGELRPGIAIAPPGKEDGCLPIASGFGLHPAMAPLHELYQQGVFAPIINVGSPHPTRSHFDAQDFMEYAAPGVRTITEGWLNRWLSATHEGKRKEVELRALAAQPLLPRSLRGEFPVLAVPEEHAMAAMDPFEEVYTCRDEGMEGPAFDAAAAPIVAAGENTIKKLRRLQEILAPIQGTHAEVEYPRSPLGRQFQGIAKVIKANCGLEVAAVDYNGWDHHAREGGTDGQLANMLKNVSDTLAAFARDLGAARMQRVLVLAMSEFGRTVKENGNSGTDHGHGGIMFALGGPVKGGKVYGKWTGLEDAALWEGRDMPVHTDFRLVFGEVLRSFLGYPKVEAFFPGYKPQGSLLGFLKKA